MKKQATTANVHVVDSSRIELSRKLKEEILARTPALVWVIDGTSYRCPLLPKACPHCGRKSIVVLPPPVAEKQTDGTTHVCHPSIGGCNHGFEVERPFSEAEVQS